MVIKSQLGLWLILVFQNKNNSFLLLVTRL